MANELKALAPASGLAVYFVINNSTSQVWNQLTTAFENYATANLTTTKYCIPATNQGTASLRYVANFPSSITAGVYSVDAYLQAGGSPAEGDPPLGSNPAFQWSGAAAVPLYNAPVQLAAAGLDGVAVESGLNARQALAVVASAVAGTLAGAAGPTVTIAGAGVSTTRITATVDAAGDRTAVTLSPPA